MFDNKNSRKIVKYAFTSSMFELYDFVLFGVMIVILSEKFFPGSGESQLQYGFLVFAISFLIVPISSFFWGRFADRHGRIKMIKITLNLMALPSLAIVFMPTYEQIGDLAFYGIIACRILQGVSSGGAYSGLKIFTMESIGREHFGKIAGFLSCAGSFGVLLAMLASFVVAKFPEIENLWRLPFLIGSALVFMGFLIRRKLTESDEFLQNAHKNEIKQMKLREILHEYRAQVAIVFVLSAFLGVFSYSMHAFMNSFLIELNYENSYAYLTGAIALFFTAISSIAIGFKIDHSKNIRHIYLILLILIFLFPFCFWLISLKNDMLAAFAIILLGCLLGSYSSTITIINYSLFPTKIRCRMFLSFYSLGVAIFGGLAPYCLNESQMVFESLLAPGWVLSLFTMIIYLLLIIFSRKINLKALTF